MGIGKLRMADRENLLVQVARQYYEQDLTQDEIARKIGTSRSTISRMLLEAREAGIVEINIHYPWKSDTSLEQELTDHFSIQQAIVLSSRGRAYSEILRGIGVLAARCLESILQPKAVLGISWGTAVHSTVQALQPGQRLQITVVQMIGAVGTEDPMIDGPDLARALANVYGGEYRYLHAPLIVENGTLRKALLEEQPIGETLSLARQSDVALVGIGSLDLNFSSLLRAGYLNQESLTQLQVQGAVGDICARHYDDQGHVMDIGLNRRIIGIELKDLQNIKYVIGVAGGEAKAEAILGALRGQHVDILVTDDTAAQKVLALVGH
jgi:DNA-binding transcriptional regulator LsrR (DeoR family)